MVNAEASSSRQSISPNEARDDYALPEGYKPFVPVSKRRAALLSTLGAKHAAKRVRHGSESEGGERSPRGANGNGENVVSAVAGVQDLPDPLTAAEEAEAAEREKARRERTLLQRAQEVKERRAREDADKTTAQLEAEKEQKLLDEMERAQRKLGGAKELAQGTEYTESLTTS